MRDTDHGKRMVEEMTLQSFLEAYPRVTGNSVEVLEQSESPDFSVLINGSEIGVELTEIHASEPDDYIDGVLRLSSKKENIFERIGAFYRPIILLCYGRHLPLFDIRTFLDETSNWIDLSKSKFSEIWLMDLSDNYYSVQDPRKPADLYCLSPSQLRGFYEIERTRKPFG